MVSAPSSDVEFADFRPIRRLSRPFLRIDSPGGAYLQMGRRFPRTLVIGVGYSIYRHRLWFAASEPPWGWSLCMALLQNLPLRDLSHPPPEQALPLTPTFTPPSRRAITNHPTFHLKPHEKDHFSARIDFRNCRRRVRRRAAAASGTPGRGEPLGKRAAAAAPARSHRGGIGTAA